MKIQLQIAGADYRADLSQPMDISLPLHADGRGPNCFYAAPFSAAPVVVGNFIGDTAQGGPVNFLDVRLNPHGNGTHTECVGHISKKKYSINQCLQRFNFIARLLSLSPTEEGGDHIVKLAALEKAFPDNPEAARACIIRTLPNGEEKRHRQYSGSNPPYLQAEIMPQLHRLGIDHLLVDLPSVDREEDGGALLAHKAFWQYPESPQWRKTITEMVFVPNSIPDGLYFLQLQIASFEIDASPSKAVLYALEKIDRPSAKK